MLFRLMRTYSLVCLLVLLFLIGISTQPAISNPEGSDSPPASMEETLGAEPTPIPNGEEINDLPGLTGVDPLDLFPEEPIEVRGIYLTAWMTGKPGFLNRILDFIEKTEINTLVVDVKDDTGTISFPSQIPLAKTIESGRRKYDPGKVLEVLQENKIYPIARIVVFKDPFLANKRTDLAVQHANGGLWQDYQGLHWVNPYNKTVWDYNIAIAREAAELGFKEIQFDYVRFTSDGNLKSCRYPGYDKRSRSDVIRDFLKYAYQELNPLGVKVSADLFGLTCSAKDDLGIGQKFEKVAEGVDIICPMVYPSHYVKGAYNLADPDAKPYETVYRSLSAAQRKLDNLGKKVIVRPWLQDFSIKSHYGREQLLAQIKAVENSGFKEWIFWNPSNKYDYRKYRLRNETVEVPDISKNTLVSPVSNGSLVEGQTPVSAGEN